MRPWTMRVTQKDPMTSLTFVSAECTSEGQHKPESKSCMRAPLLVPAQPPVGSSTNIFPLDSHIRCLFLPIGSSSLHRSSSKHPMHPFSFTHALPSQNSDAAFSWHEFMNRTQMGLFAPCLNPQTITIMADCLALLISCQQWLIFPSVVSSELVGHCSLALSCFGMLQLNMMASRNAS